MGPRQLRRQCMGDDIDNLCSKAGYEQADHRQRCIARRRHVVEIVEPGKQPPSAEQDRQPVAPFGSEAGAHTRLVHQPGHAAQQGIDCQEQHPPLGERKVEVQARQPNRFHGRVHYRRSILLFSNHLAPSNP